MTASELSKSCEQLRVLSIPRGYGKPACPFLYSKPNTIFLENACMMTFYGK
jgi:hypothetical protein